MAASARVRRMAATMAASRPQVRARAAAGAANGQPSEQAAETRRTSERVVEIQRARLLVAAVRAVDEIGYTGTTVAHITARARVSRRTFYELFQNREECLVAALEGAVARIREQVERAELAGLPWRERVRGGLWAILCFLDREPALARYCVVQSARGGQRMLERRARHLGELVAVIDEGRTPKGTPKGHTAGGESGSAGDCPPLTAEGLVGAALAIVYARLLRGEDRPLVDLQGELMGMIVLPYLGPAAARREQARPAPAPPAPAAGAGANANDVPDAGEDPLQGVPMRFTYRTARVLEAVALLGGREPGLSNRMVGEHAGIADQGQISKLLTRLERLSLLENTGVGHSKGEPNAWRLTPTGERVAWRIGAYTESFTSQGESV
jgi:AcrR family transcriptional regulator